jgi:hypothetical protein
MGLGPTGLEGPDSGKESFMGCCGFLRVEQPSIGYFQKMD